MIYVLGFLASGIVVVFAGTALARHADAIAEATKIGRIWIGSVLLAGATSLPELTTDVAAVRLGAVDLAVGDLFGSSMANMLILAVIDLLPPRKHVLQRVTLDHALAACLAISLNALAAVLVLVRSDSSLIWVGPGSLLLFLAYVAGTRAVYRHAARETVHALTPPAEDKPAEAKPPKSLSRAVAGFATAALVVLLTAPLLAWSAKGIAEISGLGHTFVGTWLVGLATSMPELVASIAAVRMGSFDLAVGNLFGSNACNMAVFLALDLAQPGNIFAALDPSHAMSALFAVVLMSLGLAAIVYRAKRRFAMLEPGSLLMLAGYVLALWLLWDHSAGAGGTP
jgi:cation:H+ antiporter